MTKLNWTKAIIAGVAGTILFDLFGLAIGAGWWDIPSLLGDKTGLGMAYGVFGHYANGMLLAILYAAIAPHLFGPYWLRPFIFIAAETVALVWFFMLPLLGAGVAGTNMGSEVPLITLGRHILFAVPFIFIINPEFTSVTQQE